MENGTASASSDRGSNEAAASATPGDGLGTAWTCRCDSVVLPVLPILPIGSPTSNRAPSTGQDAVGPEVRGTPCLAAVERDVIACRVVGLRVRSRRILSVVSCHADDAGARGTIGLSNAR